MVNIEADIKQRIHAIKEIYYKIDSIINQIPDVIPDKVKALLRDAILGDKELKELMEGIDKQRPPRLLLVGRTGVGKSSLINAFAGAYLAQVSDVESCTAGVSTYKCMDNDRVLMEIMDSRGTSESEKLSNDKSAEEQLIEELTKFVPDVVLFLVPATSRDNVNRDALLLKQLCKHYYSENYMELPVIVVVNKVDEVPPTRAKTPAEYPAKKLETIEAIRQRYKSFLAESGLKLQNIIEVSSLIDWCDSEGNEVSAIDIECMLPKEVRELQIFFDGRYKINELHTVMEDAIKDANAVMGLRMAFKLDEVMRKIAKTIINSFSTISSTVSLTPIPIADMYILLSLQSIMVAMIAALSGREVSMKTAREFLFSLGGVGGAGMMFRLAAHQLTKLGNGIFPGSGSAISASIAFAGTQAMGNAALAYYIDGKDIKEAAKVFKESTKKARAKEKELKG